MNRGYGLALAASALLSTTAVLIGYLTESHGMPPLALAFWRDLLACLSLLPVLSLVMRRTVKVSRGQLVYLLGFGFVLALFNIFWTWSVAVNGASVATVLVYCSVVFAALLDRAVFHETLQPLHAAVLPVVLLGCFFASGTAMFDGAGFSRPGVIVGLLSGLGYAGYSIMGRGAARKGLDPWVCLVYTFGIAACFLLLVIMVSPAILPRVAGGVASLGHLGGSVRGWVALFVLSAGPTVLGFGLYNASLARLPASVANLVLTTEPVFTASLAHVFLAERLSGQELLGGVLILAGVMLLRLWELPRVKLMRAHPLHEASKS